MISAKRPIALPSFLVVPLAAAALAALVSGTTMLRDVLLAIRATWPSLEERLLIPEPRVGRILSWGYNELAADVTWARTLVYYGDGVFRNSPLKDVAPLLRLVNALDPKFARPYHWGTYATTYRPGQKIQDEIRESIDLLERGVRELPEDWELHWMLGIRYVYDLKPDDEAEKLRLREKGATLMEKAMRMPNAPADLPLRAASLRTQLGQTERALRELQEMILSTSDPKVRAVLTQRYAELSAKGAGELENAARAFQAEWKAEIPFVPASLYVLIGPRPKAFDPFAIARERELDIDVPMEEPFPLAPTSAADGHFAAPE